MTEEEIESESKPTILVSSGQIENIQTCDRLHYFNNIIRIIPSMTDSKLEKGSLGHKLLEYYYKCLKEEIPITEEVIEKIIQLGLNHAVDLELNEDSRLEIVKAFKEYIDYWQGDSSWIIDDVESEFTVIIYEDEHIKIGLEGVIDLLVTHKRFNIPMVVDHKFRERNTTPSSRQVQSKVYCLATGRRDFILNSVGLQKTLNVEKKMERYDFQYSDYKLEEFQTNVIESVKAILSNWKRYTNNEYIPGRESGCFKYGRKCSYWDLCEQKPEDRSYLIERDFKLKPDNRILLEEKR